MDRHRRAFLSICTATAYTDIVTPEGEHRKETIMLIIEKPYRRERAVEYAQRWALSRNPLFPDFTGIGGDCTNFVSQCILAGGCIMDFTPIYGWYYRSPSDRAPAWAGVEYLYDFLVGIPEFSRANDGVGPWGREVERRRVMPGDVVQLANETGDFYHTLFISGVTREEIYVCGHSDDALNRALSTYRYASDRFIHIEGYRLGVQDDSCFEALLAGESLPEAAVFGQTDVGVDDES